MQGLLKLLRSIIALGIIGACIYALVNWQFGNSDEQGNRGYAESACLDEINGRFSTQSARVYSITESGKGYVVRASVTFSNGNRAKITCLANEFGRVEDVRIEER